MRNRGLPVVSIVGKPNVGKSSLFNRLCKKPHAVVFEKEGTTRDRIERVVKLRGKEFILVDTGGFMDDGADEMQALVKKQIIKAIEYSDALLFVCDGAKGASGLDSDLAETLRKSGKGIILAVNKIDNEKRKEALFDFYELGLGEVFGISCLHNSGIERLTKELVNSVPRHASQESGDRNPIRVAIVGRPNVGKSSFLNRVLDEERALVHQRPGTTRDSVDSYFEKDGILYLLIDTAGIRHKRKVKEPVDVYSMMRARKSIDEAHVVFLLVDGLEGVTADDVKIFDYIREMGKGACIIVNKWDLVKGIETSRYEAAILRKIPEARNFPIAFVSAKTGRNALQAFNLAKSIKTNLDLFIPTSQLKIFLKEESPARVKISRKKVPPKFYYMVQANVFPKEFLIFVNEPRRATGFHTAFLENRLREAFPLKGVPIRLAYKRVRRSSK